VGRAQSEPSQCSTLSLRDPGQQGFQDTWVLIPEGRMGRVPHRRGYRSVLCAGMWPYWGLWPDREPHTRKKTWWGSPARPQICLSPQLPRTGEEALHRLWGTVPPPWPRWALVDLGCLAALLWLQEAAGQWHKGWSGLFHLAGQGPSLSTVRSSSVESRGAAAVGSCEQREGQWHSPPVHTRVEWH
jgi:hypothetical protein